MKMNEKYIIKQYYKFFDNIMIKDLRQYQAGNLKYLTLDMNELLNFNPDLVSLFIEEPYKQYKLILNILKKFKENENNPDFQLRINNVDKYSKINLSHIRSDDIGKLVSVKGMLKRKSSNLIKIFSIDYLCINPNCNYSEIKLTLKQYDDKKRTLKVCPKCKSGVELIKENKIDYLQIYLEELSEDMENSAMLPEAKLIEIYGNLTTPNFINQFLVGSKIEIIGIIKEKTKHNQKGETTIRTAYIEALNIISMDDDIFNVEITEQDKTDFIELSKKENILSILKNSIAPNIAGRDKIKEATLLYIVGGTKKENGKDLIHILTIGNASLGKSVMLRRLKELLPRTVYVSAENSSAVGLVGAAVKDTFTGAWTLEAGAMPLANNGYFLLDEFDKIKKEDSTKLNEALEHQEAHINKAGIRGILKAYTPCYAAANPVGGKFDESQDYIK